jgi:hypothetical protein
MVTLCIGSHQFGMTEDGRWEMNIKLEIPELNSILQAEEFIDWLDIVEKTSRIFQMRKRSNWMLLD